MFSLFIIVAIAFGLEVALEATPLIALREAPSNCDGCHKGGRSQRPYIWRRCTLDCQGCHVDPSGAGARNEWGYYYSHDQQAMINMISPIDPMEDESFFDMHLDTRTTSVKQANTTKSFPMVLEATLRLKPFKDYLSLAYTSQLLGRTNDKLYRAVTTGDRRYREKYAVMIDALPLNTYVRAYRGIPMYGLRRPNHTLWIRERIGLGPYATVDAVQAGGTPNVPYWHYSNMQGNPYVEEPYRQKGTSYHGGMRGVTLGWHINASGWDTKSESHSVRMQAVGAGANVLDLLFYFEKNDRVVEVVDPFLSEIDVTRLHPSNKITEATVAYAGILGVMFGGIWETYDDSSRSSKRLNYFLDLHPFPNLQLEAWVRRETGERNYSDALFIAHLFFDF
tara:strand:+ start:1845 stop:3023 length:1179 start_codon:yes stop_codon:yes gene_type:complete